MISFFVPGEPRGKQRHRTGRGRTYTPQETVDAERLIGWEAKKAGVKMIEGPIELMVVASYAYPLSWPKKRRARTAAKTSKPDLDNIVKLVKDALNGIAWKDDAQVARISAWKHYSNGSNMMIAIAEMTDNAG